MQLVVLIGASGSGKTTIARAIEERYSDEIEVLYFDRIGVPPPERMIAEYGSGEEWQRAKTIEWMAKLAPLCRSGRRLLFEGQTRLSFLAEGAEAAGDPAYLPILVDCDDKTRSTRILLERKQPELAKENMMDWPICTMMGIPPLWGHSGSTGSFLYYFQDLDLYMAGTINQTESKIRPFVLRGKVIRAVRAKRSNSTIKTVHAML